MYTFVRDEKVCLSRKNSDRSVVGKFAFGQHLHKHTHSTGGLDAVAVAGRPSDHIQDDHFRGQSNISLIESKLEPN